jgi:hypothetical protein
MRKAKNHDSGVRAPANEIRKLEIRFHALAEAYSANGAHWRASREQMLSLFREARTARNAGDLDGLREAVSKLDRADDWVGRYANERRKMSGQVREGFDALVRLGWAPHRVLDCLKQIEDAKGELEMRKVATLYRDPLEKLRRKFLDLARRCDDYKSLHRRSPEAYAWQGSAFFPLRADVGRFLRREATRFQGFLRDTEPRRRSKMTMGVWTVLQMLRETKDLCGAYHERPLLDVLSGSPLGFKLPATSDDLKRWRLREKKRWADWRLPDWRAEAGYPKLVGSFADVKECFEAEKKQELKT